MGDWLGIGLSRGVIGQKESDKTAQQMIHEVAEWIRKADVKESAKFLYLLRACKFVPELTK